MSSRLADPALSRIVLIGAPAYRRAGEQLPDVPAVANNITDLAAVFTDPELGGFDPEHCVATPAEIDMDALGEVLTKAASEAEELLLIYYAGHGLLDRQYELHLALADTHPDRPKFTALPYETLRAVCLESGAKAKVVILDSCFSGRAVGQALAEQDQKILGQLDVDGTYILTSAPSHKAALVLPGERHTAFTGRLLKLLQEGDPKSGPVLTIGEIYQRLRSRLQAENLPQPQRLVTANADQLGLVRNRRVCVPVVADHGQRAVSDAAYAFLPTVNPEPAAALPTNLVGERLTHVAGFAEAWRLVAEAERVATEAPRPQTEHSTPVAPPPSRHAPRSSSRRPKNGKAAATAVLGTAALAVGAIMVWTHWGDIGHLWNHPTPTKTIAITLLPGLPDPCQLMTSSIEAKFKLSGGVHGMTVGESNNTPDCAWDTRFPDGDMHPMGAVFVGVSKGSASGTQTSVAGIATAYLGAPDGYGDCTVAWTTSFGSAWISTATATKGAPSTCSEVKQIASAIAPLVKTARPATSTALPSGTP